MYLMLHACWFLDCPYAVHKLCVLALLKPFCWKEPNLPRHLDCSVGLFPSCLTTMLSLSSQLVEHSEVLPMLSVQVAQLPTCPQPEQPQPSFPGFWAAVLAAVGAQSPLHSLALLRPRLYLQPGFMACAQSGNSSLLQSSLLMCSALLICWKIQRCTFISTQPSLPRGTLSLSLAENF